MRIWIIGSGADCDIVVAEPRVSRRHCRFTEQADGFLVEDLGSSNGTYVNGWRIDAETRVSAGDAITMGALVPMPWPPASGVPGATVIRIGRAPDNDVVLDDARVSSRHARLLVAPARTLIEDTGSSNGTFVNAPDRRIAQATPLSAADTVYFGSFAVPAARLLPGRTAPEEPPPPMTLFERPPEPPEAPPRPAPAIPWAAIAVAQAPALAVLIVLLFGRTAIAATMFGLAMTAAWLGSSMAVWAALAGRSSSSRGDEAAAGLPAAMVPRIAVLGAVGLAQCGLLLPIVHWGSGLKGSMPPMFGLLVLTSAVGLALGWLIFSLIRSPMAAAGVLVAALVVMGVLGRGAPPFLAAAMPSRWAFEGLLLLETEARTPPAVADDLAEGDFPAASERMGPRADAMALGFMLFGLAGAVAYRSAIGKAATATATGASP